MTEFVNPTDIFPATTKITHTILWPIKDLPTLDKVVDSMVGYDNLGLVIKTADITEVIQEIKEEAVETYNLISLLK